MTDKNRKGSRTIDDMTAFFAAEYSEEGWRKYSDCFPEADVQIEGFPQDIVNTVTGVLGDAGYDWLTKTPLTKFGGMTAAELLQTAEGEKALKAFIMRLPC